MSNKMYKTELLAKYGRRTDFLLIANKGDKFLSVEVIEDGSCLKIYIIPEAENVSTRLEVMDRICENEKCARVKIIEEGKRIIVSIVPKYHNIHNISGFEELFPVVEVDKISVYDDFMQISNFLPYVRDIKDHILMAKILQMQNFRIPIVSPSFKQSGEGIVYKKGENPAIGKTAEWWSETLWEFMPEKNSRMCTELEYNVFLGTLIKYLVEEEGVPIPEAWEMVCYNSEKIAYFSCNGPLEKTGNRPLGKWFDLGNTYKIIKECPQNVVENLKGYSEYSDMKIAGLSYKNKRAVDKCLADTVPIGFLTKSELDGVGLLVLDV